MGMGLPATAAKNHLHRHPAERPDGAINMARMMHGSDSDKIQVLQRMLASRGLDARDFEIEEDARSGISQLLGLAGGIVSLRRRSTGEIRVYAAGPGSTWYAAICSDFDRGYFKAATPARSFLRRNDPSPSALWV